MQRQVRRRTKEAEHTSGAANQSSSLGMGAWKHEPNKSTVQLTSLTSADHLSVSLLLRHPGLPAARCNLIIPIPPPTYYNTDHSPFPSTKTFFLRNAQKATGVTRPRPESAARSGTKSARRRPEPRTGCAFLVPMAGRGERSSENVRHARSLAGAGATTYERKRSTRPYQCMARARRWSSPPPAAASRNGIRPLACFDRP